MAVWDWLDFVVGLLAGIALAWVAALLAGVDLSAPRRRDDDGEERWR